MKEKKIYEKRTKKKKKNCERNGLNRLFTYLSREAMRLTLCKLDKNFSKQHFEIFLLFS